MSPRTNLSLAVLVLLAVITLFAAPGEAWAVDFETGIDWMGEDVHNELVTITLRTRAFLGGPILDQIKMQTEAADDEDFPVFTASFNPHSPAVIWEIEITPASLFPTNVINAGNINWQGNNQAGWFHLGE
ncbi:MAG: hypothetical protein FJY67_05705 [Calditrichaeota bacterium]|nr:hypothetical protein [Calditrichota bacterium]